MHGAIFVHFIRSGLHIYMTICMRVPLLGHHLLM